MTTSKFTLKGKNHNILDKYGVALTMKSYHGSLEAAQNAASILEGQGWTIEIIEPKTFKPAMDLEVGDEFIDDGQVWIVEENLPSINKRGNNVTVTSTQHGYNQRGSFSFNGPHQVELVVSK